MKTLLILDNTVMSNFALAGRARWLPEIWPGALATSNAAWDELQAGIRLGRLPEIDWSWLVILTLTRKERAMGAELMRPLDEGEAACLVLARSRGIAF